jgi:serine/threonine protein kinase
VPLGKGGFGEVHKGTLPDMTEVAVKASNEVTKAQGLAYMHSYTDDGIQHADVKPGNILLDAGMVPKISDFGLSKVFVDGKDYTMNVVGCLPYMDPVYKNTGRLTPKSDMYSFGIILLELICRKPAGSGESSLVQQFKTVFEQDNTGKVLFDMEGDC